MKAVDLYIETSILGPRARAGSYGYLLRTKVREKDVTLTNIVPIEKGTEYQSLQLALRDGLQRLRKPCALSIYADCQYICSVLEGRLQVWQENDWKNARNVPVKNAEIWKEILNLLNAHEFCVKYKEHYEYKEWLKHEVARKEQHNV